jgi:ATP-dependent RNA helicase DDX55/SPB4
MVSVSTLGRKLEKGYELMVLSLQNTYLVCRHAEKTLQLVRLLQRETKANEAAKYIVYFSTCAAVDYFYRVSDVM